MSTVRERIDRLLEAAFVRARTNDRDKPRDWPAIAAVADALERGVVAAEEHDRIVAELAALKKEQANPIGTAMAMMDRLEASMATADRWVSPEEHARVVSESAALREAMAADRSLLSRLGFQRDAVPGDAGAVLFARLEATERQVAALREVVHYAQTKRGSAFDFDEWDRLSRAAMAGEWVPSALENEQAVNAVLREALRVGREKRALLEQENAALRARLEVR